ncbi:hypothetical protein [Pseudolabrys sp. Root1462]|jgi:hypothetical protein|nr:hypothetical protein [Pseudolabrys sp. Root1462]
MQANITDQCVRLGLAIVLIALVSLSLYQFAGHSGPNDVTAPVVNVLN